MCGRSAAPRWEETPVAVVVVKEDSAVTAQELIELSPAGRGSRQDGHPRGFCWRRAETNTWCQPSVERRFPSVGIWLFGLWIPIFGVGFN
jgi:hypothetical protein